MSQKRGDSLILASSIAATAAVSVAFVWAYQRRENAKKYRIPFALLASPCGKELEMAVRVALQGMLLSLSFFCLYLSSENPF
jgi:hypothetical protein